NLETYGNAYILRWRIGSFFGRFALVPEYVFAEGDSFVDNYGDPIDLDEPHIIKVNNVDGTTSILFHLSSETVAEVFESRGLTFNPARAGDPIAPPIPNPDPLCPNDPPTAPPTNITLIADGGHDFELTAIDTGGLTYMIIRRFVVDIWGPNATIAFPGLVVEYDADTNTLAPAGVLVPDAVFDEWMNRPVRASVVEQWNAEQQWHNDRRVWAAGRTLPTIFRDGARATISGTFTDEVSAIAVADAGANALEFWINGTGVADGGIRLTPSIDGAGSTTVRWTVNLTQDGSAQGVSLPDGLHTLLIRVSDVAGNRSVIGPIAFRLDSARAATGFVVPANRVFGPGARFGANPVFTLNGTATDANLRGVFLTLGSYSPGTGVSSSILNNLDLEAAYNNTGHAWHPSVTRFDWVYDEYGVPTVHWQFTMTPTAYNSITPDGTFGVFVTATDWNTEGGPNYRSDRQTWTFVRDTAPPVITRNALTLDPGRNTTLPDNAGGGSAFFFGFDGDVIEGTVTDNHAVYRLQVEVERWNWATPGAWVPQQAWTDISHTGATPGARTWRVPLGASGVNHLGLDDGLYRLRLRAMDASWFVGGQPDFGPTDLGNPTAETAWTVFYFDRMNPSLVEVDPQPMVSSRVGRNGLDAAGHLNFMVEVSDNNRLRSFTATVREPGATPGTSGPPVAGATVTLTAAQLADPTLDIAGATWYDFAQGLLRLNIPVPVTRTTRGMVVVFRTYDFSGRYTEIDRPFDLDNTSPQVRLGTLIQPDMMVINNTVSSGPTLTIVGEAHDTGDVESLPARVYFRIGSIYDAGTHYLPDPERLAVRYVPGATSTNFETVDTVRNDGHFNALAGNTGIGVDSAWFPLSIPAGSSAMVSHGGLFELRSDNLFNWQIFVNNVGAFAADVALKAGGPVLPRLLPAADMPTAHNGVPVPAGLPGLPISFRIVDEAGNAGYSVILLPVNLDADEPSTTIETPSEDGIATEALGGTITVDGVASTAAPVNATDVLFRVLHGNPVVPAVNTVHTATTPVTTL
ncbi:MAG: hypothetical protein FWD88_07120, partial [Treponema sp.]|nr:hypothetical protein [Treponema sp.]